MFVVNIPFCAERSFFSFNFVPVMSMVAFVPVEPPFVKVNVPAVEVILPGAARILQYQISTLVISSLSSIVQQQWKFRVKSVLSELSVGRRSNFNPPASIASVRVIVVSEFHSEFASV